ncbi:MAG: PQQ-binding-like beta-propeller repeat protein, partial [Candidatus Thorarchaeota archaeon]
MNIKKIIIFLFLIISLFLIITINYISAQEIDFPWPMFQHDAQHTGRSSYAGPGIEYPEAQILINETDNDDFCYIITDSFGILYFGARIGENTGLYAFYPNGTQKWYYPISSPCGSPVLGPGDGIYVLLPNNKQIIAINPNGTLEWEKNFTDLIPMNHLTIENNGTLYFLANTFNASSKLVSLNPLNGNVIWSYEIEGYLDSGISSPAVGQNNTVYFGHNDTLYAINPDGTEKWNRTFVADCDYYTCYPKVTIPSIADNGTIYVVVNNERDWRSMTDQGRYNCLHAIDPVDPNQEKWSTKCLRGTTGPPTIDPEGNIYFSGWYNPMGQPIAYLYAIDPE